MFSKISDEMFHTPKRKIRNVSYPRYGFQEMFRAPFSRRKAKMFHTPHPEGGNSKCFIPPIYSNDLQICFAPPKKTLLLFVMSLLHVIGALRPNQSLGHWSKTAPRECWSSLSVNMTGPKESARTQTLDPSRKNTLPSDSVQNPIAQKCDRIYIFGIF